MRGPGAREGSRARCRCPAERGAERGPGRRGRPEAEPLPSSPPAGTEAAFVPLVPRVPLGAERRAAGGRASEAAGPEEAPGEIRSSDLELSTVTVTNQRAALGPEPGRNSEGDLLLLKRLLGLDAAFQLQASIHPVKVNLAPEGTAEAARRDKASLPSHCHWCLSLSSCGR